MNVCVCACVHVCVLKGNYGNKLDEKSPAQSSSTPPSNPIYDGNAFHYLPWMDQKPCIQVIPKQSANLLVTPGHKLFPKLLAISGHKLFPKLLAISGHKLSPKLLVISGHKLFPKLLVISGHYLSPKLLVISGHKLSPKLLVISGHKLSLNY